jgi:hypothetical protein
MYLYAKKSSNKHISLIVSSFKMHHLGDPGYAKINSGRAKPLNKYA